MRSTGWLITRRRRGAHAQAGGQNGFLQPISWLFGGCSFGGRPGARRRRGCLPPSPKPKIAAKWKSQDWTLEARTEVPAIDKPTLLLRWL